MASKKPKVVEHLYETLQRQGRNVATIDDVSDAIEYCNEHFKLDLSPNNPANFMKDLLRGMNASTNWPASLTRKRVTGRQLTGDGRVFEFIPFAKGQTEAFPNPYESDGKEDRFIVESLSLPLATKTLGRSDEAWLIQICVWMRVLENHFARKSSHALVEISHLQNNIRLGRSEIDALFLAVEEHSDGSHHNVLITCEAKQEKDPILGDQIVRQVAAAYKSIRDLDLSVDKIIPVAVKALKNDSSIYLVEFESWNSSEGGEKESKRKNLTVVSRAIYEMKPPIPGIGHSQAKRTKNLKPKL